MAQKIRYLNDRGTQVYKAANCAELANTAVTKL